MYCVLLYVPGIPGTYQATIIFNLLDITKKKICSTKRLTVTTNNNNKQQTTMMASHRFHLDWYLANIFVILVTIQRFYNVSSFTAKYQQGVVFPNHFRKPPEQNPFYHTSCSTVSSSISSSSSHHNSNNNHHHHHHQLFSSAQDFDNIVESRYACTRFQRYDGTQSAPKNPTASKSNPSIVKLAHEALDLSRRAPSGFNAQPYRLIMVDTKSKKEEVAKYCLGRNADRVRDSDCTAIFVADRECLREYKRFGAFLDKGSGSGARKRSNTSLTKWAKRKMQIFILLFSSGWPFPRIISNPISFIVRLVLSCVSIITRRKLLLPSLSSAETWASKNTMLVAMTYMLACSSRGVATSPMEGFNIGGLRKVLKIPKRYTIPLIVSTGSSYQREVEEEGFDDVGMEHGPKTSGRGFTLRYPKDEVIYYNEFGINTGLKT